MQEPAGAPILSTVCNTPDCNTHTRSLGQSSWQFFESGSVSGFNGVPGSVSGSKRAKRPTKNLKKLINFIFWSAGCSLLRVEGFFCSLEVLYEGLGISKLQFMIKNYKKKFSAVIFSIFGHQNPGSVYRSAMTKNAKSWSVSGSSLTNADLQHCLNKVDTDPSRMGI
jgi:hypothetical protein